MAKSNYDPNSPLIQASITADGGNAWPVVDTLGDPSMRTNTTRPDYLESEYTVNDSMGPDVDELGHPTVAPAPDYARTPRTGEDTASFGTNDSTISDDANGPVNIPLNAPDYGMQDAGIPDDGWGPYGENAPTGLPPGSFRGAVHMTDPQCVPGPQSLLGAEDFA